MAQLSSLPAQIVVQDAATYLASPAPEGHRCAASPMSSYVCRYLMYFRVSQITLVAYI